MGKGQQIVLLEASSTHVISWGFEKILQADLIIPYCDPFLVDLFVATGPNVVVKPSFVCPSTCFRGLSVSPVGKGTILCLALPKIRFQGKHRPPRRWWWTNPIQKDKYVRMVESEKLQHNLPNKFAHLSERLCHAIGYQSW